MPKRADGLSWEDLDGLTWEEADALPWESLHTGLVTIGQSHTPGPTAAGLYIPMPSAGQSHTPGPGAAQYV